MEAAEQLTFTVVGKKNKNGCTFAKILSAFSFSLIYRCHIAAKLYNVLGFIAIFGSPGIAVPAS